MVSDYKSLREVIQNTTKEHLCGESEAVDKQRGRSGVYITELGRVGARERPGYLAYVGTNDRGWDDGCDG